jgi:N-acetylneuraminate synthase
LDAVEFLSPYVDEFKIGSYEILRHDLIKACATTQKPITISVGGATPEEIVSAVQATQEGSFDYYYYRPGLTLLACGPSYPASLKESNLAQLSRLVDTIIDSTAVSVGYSDHTTEPGVIIKAVALGAKVVEFHLDLEDRLGAETTHGHVWYPERIRNCVIDPIRTGELASKLSLGTHDESLWDEMRKNRTDPIDGARPRMHFFRKADWIEKVDKEEK